MKGKEIPLKNYKIRILTLCFAVVLLLTRPINALTRASDYIHGYAIDVYTSGQKICTDFSVDATGKMTKLGASSIKIYEYPYGSGDLVSTKTEYSTGMTQANSYTYSNTITYTGEANKKYKVVVTIFARDASGSDSRTETHYVST